MSYTLTHPDGGEIQARAEDVPMYESQGWKTAPTVKSPTEADEPKKK